MEEFETKPINTAAQPPRLCRDTLMSLCHPKYRTQDSIYTMPSPLTLTCSSLQRNPTHMDLYPFWIHLLHQDLTTHYLQQCTGNLTTQTSTFIAIATTTFLLRIVYLTPSHIEQGLFVQTHIYYRRRRSILRGAIRSAHFLFGQQPSIWWCPVPKGWIRVQKHVIKVGIQVYFKGGKTIKIFLLAH